MIPLRDYIIENRLYWLDVESLAYRIEDYEWVEDVEHTACKGFAIIFRRTLKTKELAAIYVDAGKLFLQVGKERWCLEDDNIKIKWKTCISIIRYCFKVYKNDRIVFKHKYLSRFFFHPLNFIDITYDSLDAELDDFFMWIGKKKIKNESWAKNTRLSWDKGILGATEEKLIEELNREDKNIITDPKIIPYANEGKRQRKIYIKKKLENIKKWKEAKKNNQCTKENSILNE